MNSLHYYIVKPNNGELYDNIVETSNGSFILSSSIENHETTNRQAIVLAAPSKLKTDVLPGAVIIVHHNVFRKYNDMKGNEVFAAGLITGDTYMVDPYQVFMYKNPGDHDWTTLDPFCFVSPIDNDDAFSNSSTKELWGTMEYPNKYLTDLGIKKGDKIGFRTDSEYEFNIEGNKYYRVNSNNICLKAQEK